MAPPSYSESSSSSGSILRTIGYYDSLRRKNTTARNGNIDVVLEDDGAADTTNIAVCHLSGIFPFTEGNGVPSKASLETAANIVLAVEHLNTGNGVIVPQVGRLNERCGVRFTVEFADTEYEGGVALEHVVTQANRDGDGPDDEDGGNRKPPCAFIGATRSSVSMPAAIGSGIFGYPQVSPDSTSVDLDDKSTYPLFARTVSSDTGNTVPIVMYLYHVLRVRHLAVINVNDSYGNAYVDGMRRAAEQYAPDLKIHQIPLEDDGSNPASVAAAIDALKRTQYRFVFGVLFTREIHDALLLEAYRQGVAGTGVHNWIFGDSFLGVLDDRTVERGSPLHLAYRGVGLIEVTGGVPGLPAFDNYATELAALTKDPADLDAFAALIPQHPSTEKQVGSRPPFVYEENFLNPITNGFAPFGYEATIALGLAACDAYQNIGEHEEAAEFTGQAHYQHLVNVSFAGVGGKVVFDRETGTRLPDSALHKVANWIEEDERGAIDPETGKTMVRFHPVITDLFRDGSWTELEDYVYNDGTTVLPADLPPPADPGPRWGVAIGLPAAIVALLIAFVVHLRRERNRRKRDNDMVWQVDKEELIFADPPDVVGRGTFGLVLLAEYRGTKVAVKRVLPPKAKKKTTTTTKRQRGGKGGKQQQQLESSFHDDGYSDSDYDDDNDIKETRESNTKKALGSWAGLGWSSMDSTIKGTSSGYSYSKRVGASSSSGVSAGMMSGCSMSSFDGDDTTLSEGSNTTTNDNHNNAKFKSLTKKKGSREAAMYRRLKADFCEEMKHVSKLRHPCIVTVMGAVITKTEEPMLVMEYMDHGSLHSMLHNDTMLLEGELILPLLRDVSQGCRFLHSASPQIVHGDLKAANILVDSKFRAKVADFGLSQKKQVGCAAAGVAAHTGTATGTPFWMAPELLRCESMNTTMSDVYSFGILLYEVFSRKDPYHDDDESGLDAREILRRVKDPKINKRPPVPGGCPSQMAALMRDCLVADPDERPSFEELDKRLRRVDVESEELALAQRKTARGSPKNTTISLFDIFPEHIAEALRDGKKVEAEHRDVVTIFFSDIVGFTTISSTLEPRKVANMLDRLYLKFDSLSREHDVFKVETIGDAYMAVTNLVKDQHDDHAKRIAKFAVSCVQAATETLVDTERPEMGTVSIRVGFHSGPVVADVVGSRNPRYCLFGDTVNVASRMESNSRMNKIHCSKSAAALLKKQYPAMPLKFRGAIEVKGKGEMETYWVNQGPGALKATTADMVAKQEQAPLIQEQALPPPPSSPSIAPAVQGEEESSVSNDGTSSSLLLIEATDRTIGSSTTEQQCDDECHDIEAQEAPQSPVVGNQARSKMRDIEASLVKLTKYNRPPPVDDDDESDSIHC